MASESLFKNCKSCGKSVSQSASKCPYCGAKLKKLSVIHWIGIGLVVLIIIGIANAPSNSKSTSVASTSITPSNSVSAIPQVEQQFIAVLNQYAGEFGNAANELQQSALRDKRRDALGQTIGSRRIDSWRGTIAELKTNTDGKAILSIRIATDIEIKTWNNALSDITSGTLIEKWNPVYNSLINLKLGDAVEFSGSFLPSENDYLQESSLTIMGSITQPEFLCKFSSVNAIQ